MPRSVLIIDDSETIRQNVKDVLQSKNIFDEYHSAENGIEGFKTLAEKPITMVLCDVLMPGIDGFKFLGLKKSKSELSDIPVIMLTGQEDPRAKVQCLEAGASDYLTKPFHKEELIARVVVHLKIKELQDELLEKNQRLVELSRTDSLTGLSNRRHFMEMLQLEFLRAKRYEQPMSCIMLDVDHFKKFNDDFGHQVGDAALRLVSQAIQDNVRVHDVAGRYGGEEFAIVLPNTDLVGAQAVAERCRCAIANIHLEVPEGIQQVTISAGVASFDRSAIELPDELLNLADTALYKAKDLGRNQVQLSDGDP